MDVSTALELTGTSCIVEADNPFDLQICCEGKAACPRPTVDIAAASLSAAPWLPLVAGAQMPPPRRQTRCQHVYRGYMTQASEGPAQRLTATAQLPGNASAPASRWLLTLATFGANWRVKMKQSMRCCRRGMSMISRK